MVIKLPRSRESTPPSPLHPRRLPLHTSLRPAPYRVLYSTVHVCALRPPPPSAPSYLYLWLRFGSYLYLSRLPPVSFYRYSTLLMKCLLPCFGESLLARARFFRATG